MAFIGFEGVERFVGRVTTNVAIANASVHIAMSTNGGESASATIVVKPKERKIAVTAITLALAVKPTPDLQSRTMLPK